MNVEDVLKQAELLRKQYPHSKLKLVILADEIYRLRKGKKCTGPCSKKKKTSKKK